MLIGCTDNKDGQTFLHYSINNTYLYVTLLLPPCHPHSYVKTQQWTVIRLQTILHSRRVNHENLVTVSSPLSRLVSASQLINIKVEDMSETSCSHTRINVVTSQSKMVLSHICRPDISVAFIIRPTTAQH